MLDEYTKPFYYFVKNVIKIILLINGKGTFLSLSLGRKLRPQSLARIQHLQELHNDNLSIVKKKKHNVTFDFLLIKQLLKFFLLMSFTNAK